MKTEAIVRELEQAHVALGVRVRRERGAFRGGRCIVGEEEVIVLNRRHPPEAQVAILAESLRGLAIDHVYLRPAVRAALEEQWRRADEGLQDDVGTGEAVMGDE